jgi:hypothetical protein
VQKPVIKFPEIVHTLSILLTIKADYITECFAGENEGILLNDWIKTTPD